MYKNMEKEAPTSSNPENVQEQTGLHLECVDRVMKLPVIEAAWSQSTGMYEKVKGSSGVLNWTLSTAEATVQKAAEVATPIAKRLETPINVMDKTLCKGLTLVENTLPIVKEPPQQIYETAKSYLTPTYNKVNAVKDMGIQKAVSLKELSRNKANEVLATRYGTAAVSGLDTTAAVAEKYLDYYFPASDEETETAPEETANEDQVSHTVNTVGRFSNKLARRVYRKVSHRVQNLNRENVQDYVSSLLAAIHLTNYLNSFRQQPEPEEKTPQTQVIAAK